MAGVIHPRLWDPLPWSLVPMQPRELRWLSPLSSLGAPGQASCLLDPGQQEVPGSAPRAGSCEPTVSIPCLVSWKEPQCCS